MTQMSHGFGTCPRCQCILALTGGRLPRHRAPVSRRYQQGRDYSVPLTGLDAPWCSPLAHTHTEKELRDGTQK